MPLKVIITIVTVLAAITVGLFYFTQNFLSIQDSNLVVNDEGSIVESEREQPEEFRYYLDRAQKFTEEPILFEDSTKTTEIVFKDLLVQARNPGSNLYVNGVNVGVVDGMAIADAQFSEDERFFTFKSLAVCGAGCGDIVLYSLDLHTLVLSRIQ